MELYKTFSKLPLDRYEDYLSMIRNGDYRNIQADDVQDVRLLSYEHTITRNMANVEIPLQDGLYNFINENVSSRHFYGYIQNEKISIYSNNEAKYGHSTLYNVFYEKFLNQRIKKYVLSEYAEKISEKMQLENIKRQLEKNEVYICYATMQYRGEIFHKKFRFVYLDAVSYTHLTLPTILRV